MNNYRYFLLGIPAIVWQILFFYIPLIFIVGLSFSGATYSQYFAPFFGATYFSIIARSLILALSNAIVCTLIAYPLAYFLAFRAGRFKYFFLFLVILPFWNNFLLHISAWIFVLDRHGVLNNFLTGVGLIQDPLPILNSPVAVGIMMVYFYLPFMVLPLYATLERFDRRLIEASSDLGATWWQTVTKILLPLSMSGIRSGFFLVFIPSFGEFAIPEFMGGNKTMYVGSLVSHLILGSQTVASGAAFTLISSVVLLVAVIFIYWCLRSKSEGRGSKEWNSKEQSSERIGDV